METLIPPSVVGPRHSLARGRALVLAIPVLAVLFTAPVFSQAPPAPNPSIVDAARAAREQQSNSAAHPKVFTNDDLAPQPATPPVEPPLTPAPPGVAVTPQLPSPQNAPEAAAPEKSGCDNPNAEAIQRELQAAEAERDQLRNELSPQTEVVTGNNVDMTNFKPGTSGVDLGSPALLQSQPQAPGRVDEVILNQKIASLREDLHIACGSEEDAQAQRELYSAQQRLNWLQQEFSLDRAAYYSKPDYSGDTEGKAKLDAQQQEIDSLQSEIERLKSELAAPKTNQSSQ